VDIAAKDGASTTDGLSCGFSRISWKLLNTVSSEYVIGAEDVLEITVWRNPDLSRLSKSVRWQFSMPVIRDVPPWGNAL
jgi:protein involved in polysaccharide export with SLBB domain